MTPAAAVAVATRQRPVRLRWLLGALAAQTCPPHEFEVVVAHDPACQRTAHVLATHPLRAAGRLRAVPFPPGSGFPGAGRNAAWRASEAELILFTDDDCRPDRDWVARALEAWRGRPDLVIQGRTIPDPQESTTLVGAPWTQTILTSPPTGWAEACNIAYPRELLEHVHGFAEDMRVGEDTELWLRSRQAGACLQAEPEMLVYHAVHARALPGAAASATRWRDLACLVRRQPEVREQLWGRVWWKPEHAALCAAALGGVLARWDPRTALLALPWLSMSMRHRGYGPRGLARSASELPGRALIDAAEVLTMLWGSARHGTLLL